jgi:hypothetical protein
VAGVISCSTKRMFFVWFSVTLYVKTLEKHSMFALSGGLCMLFSLVGIDMLGWIGFLLPSKNRLLFLDTYRFDSSIYTGNSMIYESYVCFYAFEEFHHEEC